MISYYEASREQLCGFDMPHDHIQCEPGCNDDDHISCINSLWNIVCSLHNASLLTIQRIPIHSLKPYWNEELDHLKSDSIFWHNLWLSVGRHFIRSTE